MSKAVIRVPAKTRAKTPGELECEDLLARIVALEAEEKKRNPKFQVPDPPKGFIRAR